MTNEDIVRMLNQIADFYRPYPRDEAVTGIGGHIRDFWDPRMRAALKAYLSAGGKDLDPLALEGAKLASAS
jgi:formate dehydrogenase subunit delta